MVLTNPVQAIEKSTVMITAKTNGFAVDEDTLPC